MADIQLDFGLDKVTTESNITTQLSEIVKNINNSGALKFSAELNQSSIDKIKSQLDSLASHNPKQKSTFSTTQLDLYATKVENAQEKIQGLKAKIDSLGQTSVSTANIDTQLTQLQSSLAKAQNANLSNKDRISALNDVKSSLTQLNAEIQKTTTQYNNLSAAKRESTRKNKQEQSEINKSINKYNQVFDIMQKYGDKIKRLNPDLFKKGQNLLSGFGENGDYYKKSIQEQEKITTSWIRDLNNAGIKVDSLGEKLKNLFTQHLDTAIAMAGIHALQQALQQVYQNVVQLDSAVTDLQIASGYSREQTKQLVSEYSGLAQQLGSTTTEVASAADGWMRQGYDVKETNELVTDSMMLSKLGQIESEEATTALTSSLKGYKLEVADGINIVDKLTAVDMEAAASAGGIATAMAKCASSANLAGVSMNDLIGYLAEVKQVSQDNDESVGTFAKTLFARMGNIKAKNLIDPETGESLSDVETVLSGVNIKLRDSNSNFRNFSEVLKEVADNWNNYSNVQQHAIAAAFAGTRQQDKFIILMENMDEALRLSTVAAESAGSAQEKYANAYLPSVEAAQNNVTAAFEKFSQAVLDSGLVSGTFNAASGILGFLTNLVSIADGLPVKIIAIVSAIALLDKLKIGKFMPSIPEINLNGRVSKSVNWICNKHIIWETHISYCGYNVA